MMIDRTVSSLSKPIATDETLPEDELESLLIAFSRGDTEALGKLDLRLHKRLLRTVQAATPDLLVADRAEDVVQQLWLILLRRRNRRGAINFDPTRGSGLAYLRRILLNDAVREVRAAFTPPGQRPRRQATTEDDAEDVRTVLSLDHPVGDEESPLSDVVPDDKIDRDDPVAVSAIGDILVREIFVLAAREAPPAVAETLHLMVEQGLTISETGTQVGVHRATLRKRVARFAAVSDIKQFASVA